MSRSAHRTDIVFFVAVLALLVGGLIWASRSRSQPALSESAPSVGAQPPVSTQTAASASATWSGELVLLRDNALIGRVSDGKERTIYTAPESMTIAGVTQLAGEHVLVGLGGSASSVIDVNVRTGETTDRVDLKTVQLTALRPTTSGVATISFSNAERDFGSTVNLTEKDSTRALYKAGGATVTALAWRADGDALAIGTQTSVIVVPLTSGDAKSFELSSPVRSLSWSGSSVIAVTDKEGAVEISPAGNPTIASLSAGFGDVGRDFYEYAPDRFIWLRSASGSSTIAATTQDSVQYLSDKAKPIDVVTASRLLGFITQ